MTAVSLSFLIGMVTAVRTEITLRYEADLGVILNLKDAPDEIEWVAPSKQGAFRYRYHKGNEDNVWESGTGGALFELLPRMPQKAKELGMLGDIKPVVTISAGKYAQETAHYAYVHPVMSGDVRMIHHLKLMPVAMDILSLFAKQMQAVPEDINWREERDPRILAAA